jgi:hypothetical protein
MSLGAFCLRTTLRTLGAIAGGIGDPAIDGGFMPTCAIDADWHLARECAFGDLAIERRAGQAGAGKHGLYTDDPFSVGHETFFHSLTVDEAP